MQRIIKDNMVKESVEMKPNLLSGKVDNQKKEKSLIQNSSSGSYGCSINGSRNRTNFMVSKKNHMFL